MSSIIYSRDFVITALPLTCKSFHDLSDAFYHDLEQKMVADPFVSMQHFKLVLPEECIGIEDGATTTLSTFITTNNLFGVNISESVQYKGNSKAFRELATGNVISFSEWEAFVDFMRSLYVEPKPKPPDLATITEYDQLMIPRARDEPFSYEDLKAKLSQRVMGQEEAVDTIAYQTADVIKAMEEDTSALGLIKVDGGASQNDFLMQFQSDILGRSIIRPRNVESTATGAAFLAGLHCGFWENREELNRVSQKFREFIPAMQESERSRLTDGWKQAVGRSLMK